MLSKERGDLYGGLCKITTYFVNPLFGYVVTMIEGVNFLIGVSLSHHTSATPGGAIVYLFALQTIPFLQVHNFSLFLTCTSPLWELRTDFPFFIEPQWSVALGVLWRLLWHILSRDDGGIASSKMIYHIIREFFPLFVAHNSATILRFLKIIQREVGNCCETNLLK